MSWSEFFAEYGPYVASLLVGVATYVLARGDNQVNDRANEVRIQGMFADWSQDLHEEHKDQRTDLDALKRNQEALRVQDARNRAEIARMQQLLRTERTIHKLKVAIMAEENGKQRRQIALLAKRVDELTERVAELEDERVARIEAERQRDQLKVERDNLIIRVRELEAQIEIQRVEIQEMAARLRKLNVGDEEDNS